MTEPRPDDAILADLAIRDARSDLVLAYSSPAASRLADDVPGILARAVAAEAEATDLRKIIEDAHRTCDALGVPRRPIVPLNDRIEAAARARVAELEHDLVMADDISTEHIAKWQAERARVAAVEAALTQVKDEIPSIKEWIAEFDVSASVIEASFTEIDAALAAASPPEETPTDR